MVVEKEWEDQKEDDEKEEKEERREHATAEPDWPEHTKPTTNEPIKSNYKRTPAVRRTLRDPWRYADPCTPAMELQTTKICLYA